MWEKNQQIIQSHSVLIVRVVKACQNRDLLAELEPTLVTAEKNGWGELVKIIRRIISSDRDPDLTSGLDEEDVIIIDAILRGLQDSATLPDPSTPADSTMAAPGLAYMIHSANTGDTNALQLVATMAEQMTKVRGDMRRLGSTVSRMVNGERDPDKLCAGMDTRGEKLVLNILEELNKLHAH